jgi:hypothetical protein
VFHIEHKAQVTLSGPNFFTQTFITFEISDLATIVRVRVVPGRAGSRARLGQGIMTLDI